MGRQRASASAYMWLGVDAAEKSSQIGEAIAWLQLAKSTIDSTPARFKMGSKRKTGTTVATSSTATAGPDELGSLDEFLDVYRTMNDKVRKITFWLAVLLQRGGQGRSDILYLPSLHRLRSSPSHPHRPCSPACPQVGPHYEPENSNVPLSPLGRPMLQILPPPAQDPPTRTGPAPPRVKVGRTWMEQ
jgi:hypothetical protein